MIMCLHTSSCRSIYYAVRHNTANVADMRDAGSTVLSVGSGVVIHCDLQLKFVSNAFNLGFHLYTFTMMYAHCCKPCGCILLIAVDKLGSETVVNSMQQLWSPISG